MKNIFRTMVLKVLASGALFMAVSSVSSACSAGNYQEEIPDSVKSLRKF